VNEPQTTPFSGERQRHGTRHVAKVGAAAEDVDGALLDVDGHFLDAVEIALPAVDVAVALEGAGRRLSFELPESDHREALHERARVDVAQAGVNPKGILARAVDQRRLHANGVQREGVRRRGRREQQAEKCVAACRAGSKAHAAGDSRAARATGVSALTR
jgi:hypothetical protein